MAVPTLVLGAFNLSDISGSAYGASVIASGTSKGSPVPLEVAVRTWLQDGSVVVTQGYDNRTVAVRVKLRAPTATALAQAEAALFAELGRPNTLTWTPASGPASVLVVVTSSMNAVEDETSDLAESRASYPWRHYDLRLICEAFVRSASETVTASLPATGSTTTSLDAGSSTAGWTGTNNGVATTVSTSGGALSITASAFAGGVLTQRMLKTFAATTTSTKYLMVDWKSTISGGNGAYDLARLGSLSATGDGVQLPLLAEVPSPTVGYVRSYFEVAASALAAVVLQRVAVVNVRNDVDEPDVSLLVDQVSVTNVNPIFGTGRQQARVLPVGGSAPSKASVALEASTSLGDVLLYVYPSTDTTKGYSPACRQFRVASASTPTSDSSTVSGFYDTFTSVASVSYDIPMGLFPAGTYLPVVRMRLSSGTADTTLTWAVDTRLGSNAIGSQTSDVATPDVGTAYKIFPLEPISMPTVDVPAGSPATMRFSLTPSNTSTRIDEVWLFNLSIGQLTQVECGTGSAAVGGPAKRLFLEPASVTNPRPTLRVGHSADRSDAFYPFGAVRGWQAPVLSPPQVNVFAVTTGATDAALSGRGFDRWHTNAAS